MEQAGSSSSFTSSSFEKPQDDLIQHRIVDIRKQLDHTYKIFVDAKEQLSNISFENLSEKLDVETMTTQQPEEILVVGANTEIDVAKSLEKLSEMTTTKGHKTISKLEKIPELDKFFRVMVDLKEGIKKINMHQESIAKLNADIDSFTEGVHKRNLDEHFSKCSINHE